MADRSAEDILELKAALKLNELKLSSLIDILAKEGIVKRKDVEERFSELCEEGGADE